VPFGPQGPDRLASSVRQLVHGVSALHAAGRIHCDLKPSNVRVTLSGRVVLLDLGLSRSAPVVPAFPAFPAAAVATGSGREMAGTLAYMAPEVLWGEPPSPASDWYSVGILLYEALCGRLPFAGHPLWVLRDKQRRRARSLAELAPDAPPALIPVIWGLLEPDPRRRLDGAALLGALPLPRHGARDPALEAAHEPRAEPSNSARLEPSGPSDAAALEALRSAFIRCRAGRPALVLVHGGAGLERSALLRRFYLEIAAAAPRVVRGRCRPSESVPYRVFDPLIDQLSAELIDDDEGGPLIPGLERALVASFPVLGRVPAFGAAAPSPEAPEAEQLRLRRGPEALRALLLALAARRPLVLQVDGVEWGDAGSLLLFRGLLGGRGVEPRPLLVMSQASEGRTLFSRALAALVRQLEPGTLFAIDLTSPSLEARPQRMSRSASRLRPCSTR
jgi:hypothetical protein